MKVARVLKILHEMSAIGVGGSLASCLVLTWKAPAESLAAFAAGRQDIALMAKYLFMPSLALVLISGLLSIAATAAFQNAGWAWVKALLGISVFEGGLSIVGESGRRAAEWSAMVTAGQADASQMAPLLHAERSALWLLLIVSAVNVLLAVWRPKLFRGINA